MLSPTRKVAEEGGLIKVATMQDCISPPSSLFSRGNQLIHVFTFPTRYDRKLFRDL
jgi:hypothetical protein